jgi:hypothetical protein
MMFVGGEEGMIDEVRQVNALRQSRPELTSGRARHGWPVADRDELFTVSHEAANGGAILAVNLSDHDISGRLAGQTGLVRDLLDGTECDLAGKIAWAPFQARYLAREP